MIPQGPNAWTNVPVPQEFQTPYSEKYNPFLQNVMGGTALNNGRDGRDVQQWTIFYEDNFIKLKPSSGDVVWQMQVPGVIAVSVAFDSNMSQVVAFKKDDGCCMYYYDTMERNYRFREFPGATNCRTFVDDPRDSYSASSDVFFVYTLNKKLYYRQQRDRYDTEYFIGNTSRELRRAGPNIARRVQIELI